MSSPRRYLPLFTPEENWIERPDLYLMARMDSADRADENVVSQVYEAMCRSNNSRARLDAFGQTIEKHHISKNLTERLWAGQVLLEMVRIAATTQKSPSQAKAVQLAAFNHHRVFSRSSAEVLQRNVRRGFTNFRNTAHLQAVLVLQDPDISEIEGSMEQTVRFLSRARGLERFVDSHVAGRHFEWSPWRVPARIPIQSKILVNKLSNQELKVIGEL